MKTTKKDPAFDRKTVLYEGKWHIFDPKGVKFKERTPFLQGIQGVYEVTPDPVTFITHNGIPRELVHIPLPLNLVTLANVYKQLQSADARLPKFSRWTTGLFPGNKSVQEVTAKLGQCIANRKVHISTSVVDILRSGESPHFLSCLGFRFLESYPTSLFPQVPLQLAEEYAGVGVAYTQDDNEQMTARRFFLHAKLKETGEDVVVVQDSAPSNGLTMEQIATALATKGVKVFVADMSNYKTVSNLTFVDPPPESLHFDVVRSENYKYKQVKELT